MTKLRVFALGGLGEIGLNMTVVEYGDNILLVDSGLLFPDLHWMGLDLVIPDFTYLLDKVDRIKGLVITHGHEDHIGAIPFLLQKIKIPIIYCSRFAGRLVEEKCREHGVLQDLLTYPVRAGDALDVGVFNVEFIHITHSTLESFALAIRTPHGTIVHSGDFKFDETPYAGPPSDKKRLKEIGKTAPLLLLSDSTNSERCGHSESESSITQELKKLIKASPGAVVVALFASNVHRVQQLMDIAESLGRKVFLSGRSMSKYVQIAAEEKFLPVNLSLLRPIEEVSRYPRREILVLSTGSQGEARSSLLRLAKSENSFLKLQPDDVVILSSRNIPGNERAVSSVVNSLFKLGAEVYYEGPNKVHVSGHAYQSEQLELLKLIKPRFFIPVHGEYRHLMMHARTAQESGLVAGGPFILENGHVWEYDGETGQAQVSGTVQTGRHWVLHGHSGELDDLSIKDRKAAARSGIVVVDCLVAEHASHLTQTPHVTLKGFLCAPAMLGPIRESVERQAQDAFSEWREDNEAGMTREQFVGIAARRAVKRHLDVKPLTIVNFINVGR